MGERVPLMCHSLLRAVLSEDIGAAREIIAGDTLIDRLDKRHLTAATMQAMVYTPQGAVEAGYLDEVTSADAVLDQARLFETTVEAVADLHHLYAATARSRDMLKPVLTPRRAAAEMRRQIAAGGRPGLLFGPEKAGLDNDEVALADAIVQVPLNPAFSSLNLAQAVVHLATAPKSNRVTIALGRAREAAGRAASQGLVPVHLRDAHYSGAAQLGHGEGYEYPHDDPRGWIDQQYRPDDIVGEVYYEPSHHGHERVVGEAMAARRTAGPPDSSPDEPE